MIYFESDYTYGKPKVLIAGCITLGISLFLMCYFFPLLSDVSEVIDQIHESPKIIFAILLILAIFVLFTFTGIYFIKSYLTQYKAHLEISDKGIQYGKSSHTWDQIKWISGTQDKRGINLFYQIHGVKGFDRHLMVDEMFSEEQYQNLMEKLEQDLTPKYPKLNIG